MYACIFLVGPEHPVRVPRYDKSLRSGRGDRSPAPDVLNSEFILILAPPLLIAEIRLIRQMKILFMIRLSTLLWFMYVCMYVERVDIVLFEGWMLGFTPQDHQAHSTGER